MRFRLTRDQIAASTIDRDTGQDIRCRVVTDSNVILYTLDDGDTPICSELFSIEWRSADGVARWCDTKE